MLILVDTFPGVYARETAFHVAEERRAKGQFVRIVKRRAYLYAVYALCLAVLASSAGCGGRLLAGDPPPPPPSPLPETVSDAGSALVPNAPDAALPACVWVYPAADHACSADGGEMLANGAPSCTCEPGTTCEAIDVAPGQDSGGEGSRVVGCAFRPGSAP